MKSVIPMGIATAFAIALPTTAQVQAPAIQIQNDLQRSSSQDFFGSEKKQLEQGLTNSQELELYQESETASPLLRPASAPTPNSTETHQRTIYDFFNGVQGHDSPESLTNTARTSSSR